MTRGEGVKILGATGFIIGLMCAAGMVAVASDLLDSLPYMPEEWWMPEGSGTLNTDGSMTFDTRTMVSHFSMIGWLGAWGYLATLCWAPWAIWRVLKAARRGQTPGATERVLIATVALQFLALQVVVRLTPLRYAGFGLPLLC